MTPIGKFMQDVASLRVPAFQRDYAWTDEEVRQLWTDITEAIDTQQSEYFLGPMVLKKESDHFEIIDGQQRFATVYIILSCIRRILRENGDNPRADWFNNEYFGKQSIDTLERKPKFHLNDINDPTFQKFVGADVSDSKIQNEMKGLLKKNPNYLLLLAISTIWELLLDRQIEISKQEFHLDTLLYIEKFLSKNVYVLLLTVTDEADAYIIFETLNDRGLGLSTMDLLKNHVFGKSGDFLEKAKASWIIIRDNLGDIDPNERFIRHYWISHYGRASKPKLFHLMREKITSPSSALSFTEKLSEGSKVYSAILIPNHPYWNNHDQRTKQNLETINMLNAQQAFPILLAAAQEFDESEFGKLTDVLVTMAIRYNLIGELRTGVASNYYVEIPPKIRSGEIRKSAKVFRELKPIYPSDEEFEHAFSMKVLKDSRKARYILSEIENYVGGSVHQITTDTRKINLEHILPKNPSGDWRSTIESIGNDDLDDFTNRIGNLALVSKKLNKRMGSKTFHKKKDELYSLEEHFEFTKTLVNYPDWKKTSIEDRQRQLAKVAVKVWRIDIQ